MVVLIQALRNLETASVLHTHTQSDLTLGRFHYQHPKLSVVAPRAINRTWVLQEI